MNWATSNCKQPVRTIEQKHVLSIYCVMAQIKFRFSIAMMLVDTVASHHKTEPDLNKNWFSISNPITVSQYLHNTVL